MAFNREKALKAAEKLVTKGKDRDAIAKYEEILKNDPKDLNSRNKIGDLYLKVGDKPKALEHFGAVADKYASDGFTLRAIAMYKKCSRTDPARLEFHEKLADLNAQQGLTNEARAHYEHVAEAFLKEGQHAKARGYYAKIAEIEPDNLKVRLKLADLYLKDNQINLALGEYQVIGSELAKKGMLDESIQVLEKALGLDPSNLEILRSMARVHADMGKASQAIEFIRKKLAEKGGSDPDLLVVLGEAYQSAGDGPSAHQALSQAMAAAPDRSDVRVALHRLSLAQGDVDGALGHVAPVVDALAGQGKGEEALDLLRGILKVREGHPGCLEKMLAVHEAIGSDEKVRSNALSELSEAYITLGQYAQAETVLDKLVVLDPDVSQHQEKLEFVRAKLRSSQGEAAPAEMGMSMGGGGDETSFGSLDDGGEAGGFSMSFDDGELEGAGAEGDDRSEFVSEHLAEADVFVKYGLLDKAVEQLHQVLEKYPDDVQARQKLKELHLEDGKKDEAIQQCLVIARILKEAGDSAGEEEALAQAREIDPNHPSVGGAAPAAVEAEPAEVDDEAGGFELSLDTGSPAEAAQAAAEESGGFELSLDDDSAPAAPAAAEPAAGGGEFDISLDDGSEPAAEPAAGGGEFEISLDDGGGAEAPAEAPAEAGGGEFEISLDDGGGAEPAAAEPAAAGGGEFELSLDEPAAEEERRETEAVEEPAPGGGEFELSLDSGAVEAAPAPAEPAFDPHATVRPGASEAAEPAAAEPEPAAVEAAEPAPGGEAGLFGEEDDFFDFAEELNKELEDESPEMTEVSRAGDRSMSLEEIVSGIQKGVAEQVSAEDYETHYNLGIAMKEMGLIDEAIGEFQYASKDPQHFLQCCILLGACFTEKGMAELAVKWYQKGLSAEGITEDDILALRFEIAACKQAVGDDQAALDGFLEVYGLNARYRDTGDRVQALKAKLGK